MFTHARCGGVLIPIVREEPHAFDAFPTLLVRCDGCRLEGNIAEQDDHHRERRELWRGLVPK